MSKPGRLQTVDWKDRALERIRYLSITRPSFTQDDVREEDAWIRPPPQARGAEWGALLAKAEREKMCEHSGHRIPSRRRQAKERRVAVWKSLLYAPAPFTVFQ